MADGARPPRPAPRPPRRHHSVVSFQRPHQSQRLMAAWPGSTDQRVRPHPTKSFGVSGFLLRVVSTPPNGGTTIAIRFAIDNPAPPGQLTDPLWATVRTSPFRKRSGPATSWQFGFASGPPISAARYAVGLA